MANFFATTVGGAYNTEPPVFASGTTAGNAVRVWYEEVELDGLGPGAINDTVVMAIVPPGYRHLMSYLIFDDLGTVGFVDLGTRSHDDNTVNADPDRFLDGVDVDSVVPAGFESQLIGTLASDTGVGYLSEEETEIFRTIEPLPNIQP